MPTEPVDTQALIEGHLEKQMTAAIPGPGSRGAEEPSDARGRCQEFDPSFGVRMTFDPISRLVHKVMLNSLQKGHTTLVWCRESTYGCFKL